jgi:hypothetical protein
MRSNAVRFTLVPAVFAAVLLTAAPASAQFGIGGRMAMIKADTEGDDDQSDRFMGGHLRARVSPKTAIELSIDVRNEENEAGTLKVREYPIQASLLLFPVGTTFAPYLLGGAGWYSTRVQTLGLSEDVELEETTRDFGWHAGFGAEVRLGRHAGIHADYRYTFLDFGDDEDDGIVDRLTPGHKGSMWTAGFTVYF